MNRTWLDWTRWGVVCVLLAMGWLHYEGMIRYTIGMIKDPIEDLGHAWIIPVVSLYALYYQRGEFRRLAGMPSWRGLGWVLLFLAVAWFGARGGQARIAQISMIGLIWSVPYAFWGREVGRLMLFPAWFLLFTVPFSSFLDVFTVYLRMRSSEMATGILNGLGMDIERSGTAIFSKTSGAEFSVDVADPCSGIRSLVAMMALAAGFAYFVLKTPLQRWTLFACSIPIAMLGNMFRIFSICAVASWFGQDVAMGFYHEYAGFVIFGVGVVLALTLVRYLPPSEEWLREKRLIPQWLAEKPEREAVADTRAAPGRTVIITALVGGLVILTFQGSRALGTPTYDEIKFVADELPLELDGYISDRPWFCHDDQCNLTESEFTLISKKLQDGDGFKCPKCGKPMHKISLGEQSNLPADTTILKRTYRSVRGGESYAVSIVVSGKSRKSIHRPELCLPSQGFIMLNTGTYPLHVPGGKPRQTRIIQAQHSSAVYDYAMSRDKLLDVYTVQAPPSIIQKFSLAYWFVSRERERASHAGRILTDMLDRSFHNRINRWAMVSIYVTPAIDNDESIKAFEDFLGKFYPQIFRDANTP